jgi:hypothetical protein
VAEQAGLNVEATRTTTASAWQFYQWKHVIQFPAQAQRSAFWSPGQVTPREDRRRERMAQRAWRWRMHIWISRLLDMFGLGDNHVFVLRKP